MRSTDLATRQGTKAVAPAIAAGSGWHAPLTLNIITNIIYHNHAPYDKYKNLSIDVDKENADIKKSYHIIFMIISMA